MTRAVDFIVILKFFGILVVVEFEVFDEETVVEVDFIVVFIELECVFSFCGRG